MNGEGITVSRWTARRRAQSTRPGSSTPESTRTPGSLRPAASGASGASGALRRSRVQHIEVDRDWRRCGSDEGRCGVLLPLNQSVCPRCGQTNRDDLIPLNIRRLLPTHDAYEHAVAVLRGTDLT
ncbi:hypothetical protein [Frankia sp. R82]|uniref:hypothetical protein n=1 Tax=Frankia sp. R82 TaxID=2950553 RepID=UPI00204481A7|nr:hypothetical protein [Frankia sp. R82]MCM3885768.1 hypothetical protein [Frankia sp. R82]